MSQAVQLGTASAPINCVASSTKTTTIVEGVPLRSHRRGSQRPQHACRADAQLHRLSDIHHSRRSRSRMCGRDPRIAEGCRARYHPALLTSQTRGADAAADAHDHSIDALVPAEIARRPSRWRAEDAARFLEPDALAIPRLHCVGAMFAATVLAGANGAVPFGVAELLTGTVLLGLILIVLAVPAFRRQHADGHGLGVGKGRLA
jgi:hypothetical protein